jgi:FkbM family methyltransferase
MTDLESATFEDAIVSVETRYGLFFIPDRSDLIVNALRTYGEWVQAELDILCDFIAPGDTVIDGGACFGTHARAFSSKTGPDGKVICFEPSRDNRAILMLNAGGAVAQNVEVFPYALGAKHGKGSMLCTADDNAGGFRVSEGNTDGPITVVKLDEVAKSPIHFIKLDLEGAELSALIGARNILMTDRPVVFSEILNVDSGAALVWHMRGLDYSCYGMNTPAFRSDNFLGSQSDMFNGATECGLIFIHNSKVENYTDLLHTHALPYVATLDDLVVLLLEQPQYVQEVIAKGAEAIQPASPASGRHIGLFEARQIIDKLLVENGALSDEVADAQNDLDAFKSRLEVEEDKTHLLAERLNHAIDLMRKPFSISLRRNLAKAALKNLPWLSQRRRDSLVKSINKREYRNLFVGLEEFQGADLPYFTPISELAPPSDHRDFGGIASAKAPTEAEWDALRIEGGILAPNPVIDVIVPVYRGLDETMRCLYSVISQAQATPFRLLVINDCSPEVKLTDALQKLLQRGWIELIENETNLGFVLSCNSAMRAHPDRNVLLLNSDTEVYSNWLDRMVNRAESNPMVGTLTPFSNNATICSYPRFAEDNPDALELDGHALDALAAKTFHFSEMVEIPTGVGFCMYIKRMCLDVVGLFDEDNFGKGYGEENDLSQRILKAGWLNMLVPDVYVRHWGAVSFGHSSSKRIKAAIKKIDSLHPKYLQDVSEFLQKDPIRNLRAKLDAARMHYRSGGKAIMFVTHNLGGGTETHVQYLRSWIEQRGEGHVFVCRPHSLLGHFYIEDPESGVMPNRPMGSWFDDQNKLEELFASLGIQHIHVHHLINHGSMAPRALRKIARSGNFRVDFTAHDYFAICPRINLIDGSGVYCGEPDIETCQKCIDQNGAQVSGKINVSNWRRDNLALMESADTVFTPSRDVARRFGSYLVRKDIRVREHATDRILVQALEQPLKIDRSATHGARRKIAVLGAIGPHKGSELLYQTAQAAIKLGLPLEFVVIGHTNKDNKLGSLKNLRITGRYKPDEVMDIIRSEAPSLLWIPSVWPETFCFTLSEALAAGVQPVVFDLGAQADRVRQIGWGEIMPLDLLTDPHRAAQFLASCELTHPSNDVRQGLIREYANIDAYYGPVE